MKRNLLIIAAILLASFALFAQVNTAVSPIPVPQFFSAVGQPLNSEKIFTYAAGTTTPLASYTDATGITPNTNPIILNAGGFPADNNGNIVGIWLGPQKYKIIAQNSSGVQQWMADGVSGNNIFNLTNLTMAETIAPACPGFTGVLWADSTGHRWKMCNNGTADFVVGQNTTDTLTNKTINSPTISTPTMSGIVAGNPLFTSLNNIKFADSLPGSSVQLAINALPPGGGTAYQGCGLTYGGPITFPNGVKIESLCPEYYSTVLQYAAGQAISTATGIEIKGVTLTFPGTSTFGL
jgi:hypothetical protein